MKKLAIIGAQRMARNYAVNAREMGVETHCFAWNKGAVAKDFVDKFYPISIFDIDAILTELETIGIDGVVSTSELTISVVAELAAKLHLPSLGVDVAKVITDKYRNRCVTKDVQGLKQPRFALVRNSDEARNSGVGFPCILKPLSEGGKRGVVVVESEDRLEEAIRYTSNESKRQDAFLQEEFLRGGREYSVESLSYHGNNHIIQITEKTTSGPPHCVELGHSQPADLSPELRKHVTDVLGRALTAVGVTEGPCHTEIMVIDDEVYLVEFNARPGGDFISYPLIDLSTGYSYLKGAIKIAMNEFEPPEPGSLNRCFSGVCFVTKQTPELIPVFQTCDSKAWCWRKNVAGEICEMLHNDCDNANYFIWASKDGVPGELVSFIHRR